MKNIYCLIIIAFLSSALYAQDYTSEIEYYQAAYGLEKKMIVENFMDLPTESSEQFWNIYNLYETERMALGKDRMANLKKYAEAYDNMTNEQADEIAKSALKFRASSEKLYKKYYGKVKKVTNATTATQFLQLEIYLSSAIQYSILESIPFIGEN